ncbi:MAG: PPC domain-containing protein [Anaerolineaceae bacterium]|nr:PPC domain-containing protein [Anaerolineaceae bacterium]
MLLKRLSFLLGLCLLLAAPVLAQDAATSDTLTYGGRVTGRITDAAPRAVYYFDGLRGDVIAITVRVTGGSLDPILTVLDQTGTIVASLDDTAGGLNPAIPTLTIPQSGRYFVVVGRFGYGLGTTSGDYELAIERIGVSSANGSALRYGDTVINTINNLTPQVYYSFRAQKGDIISIHMQRDSGDLDPYLQVVDSNAFVVAENDDVLGGNLDANITNLLIEQTGTYIIIATRYGAATGNTAGRFVLTIGEADNSGLGNSAEASIEIGLGDVAEGDLTARYIVRYYRFEAKKDDLITVRMSRTSGNLDAFLVLANAGLQELVSDDDGGGGQNAKIEGYLIPADGTYYILATRFDREDGKTTGGYRLELQTLGNAFDTVAPDAQRISYGTTITGRLDEITPQILFSFWGTEGDVITVSLNRGDGDLDPVVSILNEEQTPLTSDDDGGGGQNARIARYRIARTGLYYIRAARFSGEVGNSDTRGSFILVLARRFDE